MLENIIDEMNKNISELQEAIILDIEDVKAAKHESLLDRNDNKQYKIDNIMQLKQNLNQEIISLVEQGIDVNIYKNKIDSLEEKLKKLYKLNRKLSMIVLPVQQMYKELVDEITSSTGGSVFDLKA
jgi:ABC-type transporter lipoprotein component MlaA